MLKVGAAIGLGPKELAHLTGASVRAIYRGVREGSTTDLVFRMLQEGLEEPRSMMSIRALALIAARGEGLKFLLAKMRTVYVNADRG